MKWDWSEESDMFMKEDSMQERLEEMDKQMSGRYYNRQGEPMKFSEWAASMENREDKIVKQEYVGDYWVSTVWLGLDHGYGLGPPLIFETMVFDESLPDTPTLEDVMNPDVTTPDQTKCTDQYCERYSTEEEALAGHKWVVEKLKTDPLSLNE